MAILADWIVRARNTFSRVQPANADKVADTSVPEEVLQRLTTDNPRLQELARRYEGHPAGSRSRWSETRLKEKLDLRSFRADNVYVWQKRGLAEEVNYILTAYYVRSVDRLGLFANLDEDSAFGAASFSFNNSRLISRDLLDSILEINFLDEALGISGWENLKVLDIGGGYGRLGYRMVCGLGNLEKYYCTDAIPQSTFLAEFYFNYRGVSDRAVALPLDQVEVLLSSTQLALAVNIHSFSECPLSAIDWWVNLLSRSRVRYLLVVPNDRGKLLSKEADGNRLDFGEVIAGYGYRLKVQRSKYSDATSLEQFGIFPADYFLFELETAR